jgi:phage gp36-like protein
MTYATQQDLVDRFGNDELLQLTDRTNSGQIDTVAVSRALADADAEINGYLAGRYALPFASAPAILVRLACDIARYQLYGDRVIDPVKQRYQDAQKLMQNLSSGAVQLGVATGQAAPVSDAGVAFVSPGRVFNTDNLADY